MKIWPGTSGPEPRRFCKDSIVNAVLNAKYNAAEDASVDSFFHVDIDEILGIDPISLCTIFSNTLDNAIEACRKIPEREKRRISLKARYTENGYFSCEIVNSKKKCDSKEKGRLPHRQGRRPLPRTGNCLNPGCGPQI